ncbi:glycosyltransferase family 31 protein [Trametes coccinea BRFM310]|uniref:Glycosyltransferase family 31 protein n=1 Tax=Trametes coccinea (strain BRFM310) TaxID=1353009 RepID=A0A1Y2IQK7_TRAC3|nr:glycosyltransferase family 31 protein [Trametes coccinea BRFM310]
MSFVRDLFQTSPRSHVPLGHVTAPQDQHYPPDDVSRAGPSTALLHNHPLDHHLPPRPSSVPLIDPPAPPYEEEEFNARAPRRSTDASLLYPTRNADSSDRYPPSTAASVCSTATNTPFASRAPSPLPFYYSGASSCSSDSESESESPSLGRPSRQPRWRTDEPRRWWQLGFRSNGTEGWRRRRKWRDVVWGVRTCKRVIRRLVRHPLFPKTPVTILLTLLFLTIFGVSLTFLLIYILNPDKEPLPWRGYCTLPQHSGRPPSLSLSPTALLQTPLPTNLTPSIFPPPDFDTLAPAGVFIGVFSMDTAVERRMLVRSTWANHVRSREGAGNGDGGIGTSRTVVRFILGQPRKDWERRVKLEMEAYNDMVILPVQENMNSGKTHAFFSWAANHSWVPPLYQDNFTRMPEEFSYMNVSNPAPVLASHDPALAHQDQLRSASPQPWVRPDFVVKADDDSFVMLAELEARLRVELYKDPIPPPPPPSDRKQSASQQSLIHARSDEEPAILDFDHIASYFDFALPSYATRVPPTLAASPPAAPEEPPSRDPLVFWGYLVKNRFMAGELYALSFALVDWVSKDPIVKTMVRGAEDKQTSKWIRAHPRAEQVRWSSERCWIYDHPRAGTVYSHGFLFPSEVKRVQEGVMRDVQRLAQQVAKETSSTAPAVPPGQNVPAPEKWSHSTVSKFGSRYSPPTGDLNLDYSVEALVEGSDMSMIHDDGSLSADLAWKYREGRRKRYDGRRVGGTVVVHFIKKNMWFLETAAALLHGEDVTPLERALDSARETEEASVGSEEPATDAENSSDAHEVREPEATTDSDRTHTRSTRTMARRRRALEGGEEWF